MSTGAQRRPEAVPKTRLGTTAATRLVAEREITTQLRSKSFLISTLIIVIIIVGGIVGASIFGGDDDEPTSVAAADVTPQVIEQVEAAGVEVTEAESMSEAETLLREDEVEAIVTADPDSPVGIQLIGLDEPPAQVAEQLAVMPTMDVLEEEGADFMLRYFAALGFGLVFMTVAMGSGVMIMQNTIQEKQNRIVEILLSAIPARALLAGKILGNSLVALGQAMVMGIAAVAGLLLSGQQDYLQMLTWPMLWFVVFFVPGFVLVASVFAASASLVSRQEDSGAVMGPAMILVMAPYFLVLIFLNNDLAMTITSYIPFTAPVSMSLWLFDGTVQWFEPLVSMAILVLTTVAVMAVAARIYNRSLLQMGQRVKLSSALRSQD